ncbi:MAG: FAD-dependent oxidoreductase [Gammaproteobacteria bacterium]|nr:FAD-dependent oxidoreductase [Gammaproteobacteria bacterium]
MQTHVIVGAGQAGGQAARTMREYGFAGRIIIVGDEPHPPHQRPPLSKAVLLGKIPPEKTHLFKAEWYADNGVELRLQTEVTRIDADTHKLTLHDGSTLDYDKLLLATGATLRRLEIPGADLAAVHYLRRIEDTLQLQSALQPGRRLVVIGGGFIGLEVAASARQLGCEVSVLEAADRLMGRAMDPWLGAYFERLHARNGVTIRLQQQVSAFEARDGACNVVTAADTLTADVIVVGIGIVPNDALARQIGAEVDNGVIVDAQCRTSVPDVFACGDVACHHNTRFGKRLRLESWENAQNQAIAAASTMCGDPARYDPVPWFWTNQFDVNLQLAGAPPRWDSRVVRGDPDSGPFTVFYLADDRIVACSAVNNAREMRAARALIEHAVPFTAQQLQDPETNLIALAKEASAAN